MICEGRDPMHPGDAQECGIQCFRQDPRLNPGREACRHDDGIPKPYRKRSALSLRRRFSRSGRCQGCHDHRRPSGGNYNQHKKNTIINHPHPIHAIQRPRHHTADPSCTRKRVILLPHPDPIDGDPPDTRRKGCPRIGADRDREDRCVRDPNAPDPLAGQPERREIPSHPHTHPHSDERARHPDRRELPSIREVSPNPACRNLRMSLTARADRKAQAMNRCPGCHTGATARSHRTRVHQPSEHRDIHPR